MIVAAIWETCVASGLREEAGVGVEDGAATSTLFDPVFAWAQVVAVGVTVLGGTITLLSLPTTSIELSMVIVMGVSSSHSGSHAGSSMVMSMESDGMPGVMLYEYGGGGGSDIEELRRALASVMSL